MTFQGFADGTKLLYKKNSVTNMSKIDRVIWHWKYLFILSFHGVLLLVFILLFGLCIVWCDHCCGRFGGICCLRIQCRNEYCEYSCIYMYVLVQQSYKRKSGSVPGPGLWRKWTEYVMKAAIFRKVLELFNNFTSPLYLLAPTGHQPPTFTSKTQ